MVEKKNTAYSFFAQGKLVTFILVDLYIPYPDSLDLLDVSAVLIL